ncbi:hypothetical protein [Geminocystis sp. GBBB08]|nr:hypothetical protein [Geminocystis sp. GBBB08]
MNIIKMLEDMTKYLTEAFSRIFSPPEELPPEIGVQPFECALYKSNK